MRVSQDHCCEEMHNRNQHAHLHPAKPRNCPQWYTPTIKAEVQLRWAELLLVVHESNLARWDLEYADELSPRNRRDKT